MPCLFTQNTHTCAAMTAAQWTGLYFVSAPLSQHQVRDLQSHCTDLFCEEHLMHFWGKYTCFNEAAITLKSSINEHLMAYAVNCFNTEWIRAILWSCKDQSIICTWSFDINRCQNLFWICIGPFERKKTVEDGATIKKWKPNLWHVPPIIMGRW